MLKIKSVPEGDRPYEKFVCNGPENMSDSELLAIILRSGSKTKNCLELAKDLLKKHENGLAGFEYLKQSSLQELMTYDGIGQVKAVQIKATLELSKRIRESKKQIKITSPKNVFELVRTNMGDKDKEELKVIILNTKNKVKSISTISIGTINCNSAPLRDILSEPIKQMASGIILVHNHPSGDTTPSRADILFTRRVVEACQTFDIDVKDHVVISDSEYTSMRETNMEIFIRRNIE